MLSQQIKSQMFEAMKAKDEVAKEILRLALGEVQTDEARTGKTADDARVEGIVRKVIKSNRETLELASDEQAKARLVREIEVLDALLPKTLDVDAIVGALEPVADAIRSAGNDGQATGVAMKHLKSTGAAVQGKDVSEAVKRIRA